MQNHGQCWIRLHRLYFQGFPFRPKILLWFNIAVALPDLIRDHRNIEQCRLEGSSKDHLVEPFHAKGCLDEIIEHSIHKYIENFQGWGFYHIHREDVPVIDCSLNQWLGSVFAYGPLWSVHDFEKHLALLPVLLLVIHGK